MSHNIIGSDFSIKAPETALRQKTEKKLILVLAKNLSVGYYLATPLLVGVLVGVAVDKYFNTKPAFTLVAIALGTISTFFNLIKIIRQQN